MNEFRTGHDTIVAPATGAPPAAIAIVRMSGPHAVEILRRVFRPSATRTVSDMRSHRLVLGTVLNASGDEIDEALAVIMRGPRSFTGEDVVELHTHGSAAVVQSVVAACLAAGARLAEPGEFTRRAFLNGRMDLVQAEALADLIHSQTEQARRVALRQLRGGLSKRIFDLRERILDVAAELEAWIDFPEEEIPQPTIACHVEILSIVREEVSRFLRGFKASRIVRDGARVVIAGRPNAGKSSLFNLLVGRERAIVTAHPGTTRDTIESTVELAGVAVTYVDTAGLRETHDEVEGLGIERAREEIGHADLVLLVIDTSLKHDPVAELQQTLGYEQPHVIVVLNKCDRAALTDIEAYKSQIHGIGANVIAVSCETRAGIDQLEETLRDFLTTHIPNEEVFLTRERHVMCLQATHDAIDRALGTMAQGLSPEFVMVDLHEALDRLNEMLGLSTDEAILDRIFARFCLGK